MHNHRNSSLAGVCDSMLKSLAAKHSIIHRVMDLLKIGLIVQTREVEI
jgi:hypothetical protein